MMASSYRSYFSTYIKRPLYSSQHRSFKSQQQPDRGSYSLKQPVIFPANSLKTTKSYYDIPYKKGLLPPSFGLILSGGPAYLHEHCDKRHKELGPIYREFLGDIELVFLSDTKLIQTVIANEGQYPHHNVPKVWNYYNQINNIERGLFFQTGEPWAKMRSAFNKVLLADPHNITKYTTDIIDINEKLFKIWSASGLDSQQILINDLKTDLCKWSIEATCFMLFGVRLGCFQNHPHSNSYSKAEDLVRNVANMFYETSRFQLLPVKLAHKLNLPAWRRFERANSKILRLATEYATRNIEKAKARDSKPSLTQDLLKLNVLTEDEVCRSMVDLIIAAADTTSNSLQWMLYCLAKYPHAQSRIYHESMSLSRSGKIDLSGNNSPFLKAFVKETLRLYPTAPFLARTLDKDIALNNYLVPSGKPFVFSLYTTSRMEKYFDQPLEFKPERWLRTESEKDAVCPKRVKNHAYASLPFGIGARMCIGRRAAEMEMCLFIASFTRNFESHLVDDDIGIKLNMILCPDKPIKLLLSSRKT